MTLSGTFGDVSRRTAWVAMLFLVCTFLALASCSEVPDSQRAAEIFADCLERNGVEVQDVEVTLNEDGSVGTISATIVSEGDVAYGPTIRMACTEEVELDR